MPVSAQQRFTKERPCPVCGGHARSQRGRGKRCYGYRSSDGEYAHCTREEHAGPLPFEQNSETYAHRLVGDCHCGTRHNNQPPTPRPSVNGNSPESIVAIYDYHDEDGDVLFQTVRYEPKDFSQRRPDGKGGWIRNLEGVRRVLYRLPELIGANPDMLVFIPEGEKHVDRLWELGLVGTTSPMGAGKWKKEQSAYVPWLKDRRVVVLPDNDTPGRRHAEQVAQSLTSVAKSVRVLPLPGLVKKGSDIINWLDAGGTAEELVKLARQAPEWEPPELAAAPTGLRFQSAAEIARETPENPAWISKPWLPLESITEVTGKIKAAGKTTFLMAMCRKVLEGADFMGEPTMKTPIVYLTEQPRSSLREALRRADLLEREDFHLLLYQDTIGTPWKEVVEAAAQECKRVGAKLLVVDTLPQFAGLRGDAENSSGAAMEALEPIQAVVALGIGVIVSRHDGKADREVGDSGRGSSQWGGMADILISIRRGEGNTSPTIRVLHSLSRFDETPDKLVVDVNTKTWEYTVVGTETQVALIQAKAAILKVAPETEEEALKTNDLIDRADGVKTTVGKEAIKELAEAGTLVPTGTGKRNDAKRYWKLERIQSEPPVVAT